MKEELKKQELMNTDITKVELKKQEVTQNDTNQEEVKKQEVTYTYTTEEKLKKQKVILLKPRPGAPLTVWMWSSVHAVYLAKEGKSVTPCQ